MIIGDIQRCAVSKGKPPTLIFGAELFHESVEAILGLTPLLNHVVGPIAYSCIELYMKPMAADVRIPTFKHTHPVTGPFGAAGPA